MPFGRQRPPECGHGRQPLPQGVERPHPSSAQGEVHGAHVSEHHQKPDCVAEHISGPCTWTTVDAHNTTTFEENSNGAVLADG